MKATSSSSSPPLGSDSLRSAASSALPSAFALLGVAYFGLIGCGANSSSSCASGECPDNAVGPGLPQPAPSPAAGGAGTAAPGPGATNSEAPGTLPLDNAMPEPIPPASGGPTGLAVNVEAQRLLDMSVKFYGAQRSGDGNNWLLGGASCHLNDGEAAGLDLTGGWYDAGDHLKVTLSIAYASYVMLKAYDAFPEAFRDLDSQRYTGEVNGVPDVLDEARYATDYLVKAHISEEQLVGMVGNTQQDHRQWVTCMDQEGLPAEQGGRERPVSLEANADVAGITAASLAIMARLYRPFDAALADAYQSHAVQVYQIGKNNQSGSNPGLYGQQGDAWLDEMLAGSAELYRLTEDSTYLTDALDFNGRIENHGWAPNYSQSADFSRHSLYVGGAADAVAEFWRLDVENYQAKVSTNEYTAGAIYFDEWGMLRYAAAAAFSAGLYAQVTGDSAARDLAVQQLSYITGENSYSRSFVVGFGNAAPEHPHHRNADNLGMLLSGALVAGPTQAGRSQGQGAAAIEITTPGYTDDVNDYVGNEVALDYNAGLVGLAAFGTLQGQSVE